MSKFFSSKFADLVAYTPGEQPKNTQYIKLNTNESPFAPTFNVIEKAQEAAHRLNLYSDPECFRLNEKIAHIYGVRQSQVITTNGSDEILNFAFMAYCDKSCGAAFADITYGFYKVFANLHGIDALILPLNDDFTINVDDYCGIGRTIFIANPNAPTGIALELSDIEKILKSNPDNVVVVDEAYVDFGGESAVKLIDEYDNLLVTQTFSKSRSLAGARLGIGFANEKLIADLNTIRYSTNPYNVNSMTMAAGIAILEDREVTDKNCQTIIKNREYTISELKDLGFEVTDSNTNFVFARHEKISGEDLYLFLKRKGILVRHFGGDRIKDYNRITIGTKEQMKIFIETVKGILEEIK